MRFPNNRVQPIITNALQTMTMTQLTEQTGVGHHSIAAIRDGTQEWVSEHVMDRLMCGLDLPELMHTEFADIYEAEEDDDELRRDLERVTRERDEARRRARRYYEQARELRKQYAAAKERESAYRLLANRRAA